MTSFIGATYKVVYVEDERHIKDARRIVHYETSSMYDAFLWIKAKEEQIAREAWDMAECYWGHWEFDVYLASSVHHVLVKGELTEEVE